MLCGGHLEILNGFILEFAFCQLTSDGTMERAPPAGSLRPLPLPLTAALQPPLPPTPSGDLGGCGEGQGTAWEDARGLP